MERNIIYHIGLPKTGTSFLQREYFPNLRGDFLLLKEYSSHRFYKEIFTWFLYVSGKRKSINPISEEMSKSRNIIYSYECISQAWFSHRNSIEEVVNRIFEYHKLKYTKTDTPHILIGFREFKSWVISYYAQLQTYVDLHDLLDDIEANLRKYDRNVIGQCLTDRFDSVFIYEQEVISKDLSSLNDWFKKFGLDGTHIVNKKHNVRKADSDKTIYLKQQYYSRTFQSIAYISIRLFFFFLPPTVRHRLIWKIRELNTVSKEITIDSTHLERIHVISEKLSSHPLRSEYPE